MAERAVGWVWVASQTVLLVLLLLLPAGTTWSTPTWLTVIGFGTTIIGLILVAVAALGLGPAVTPSPVPSSSGRLATTGLYGFVRHPIYSGVLTAVAGVVIRSGSLGTLAVGIGIVYFFNRKARWEEKRLAKRYPAYSEYAKLTPRFVPRPWRYPSKRSG